jgi:cytochrome c oxidase cbb3-type subunit 1
VRTAEIDASCRAPLLLLFVSGAIWLFVGTLLLLLSSIKSHGPGFLAGTPWLTLGRIRPAAMNTVLYGFASQTAMGVLLWMLCRLGGARLLFQSTIFIAGLLWNVGVTIGFLGILAGASTGFEWLEMPRYASVMLFIAYALIGICALVTFHFRRDRTLYVSQWYLLAALFWFPWIYSAANLLLLFQPVRGVMQAVVNAWYTNNFFHLWLAPIGLAAIFYFIPKLIERPLYNRWLAAFGFWTLAFFANWSGLNQLTSGPIPAWMVSTSIAAGVLLIVPLISVAINWHQTLAGSYHRAKEDITLRFVIFGAASYLVATAMGILLGLREVSEVTRFTYLEVARSQLALFGFVAMVLFGSLYYIVPRLVRMEWYCPKLTKIHFLCSVMGVTLIFVPLALGGVIQGFKMNMGLADMVRVIKSTIPFVGLSTLGLLLLLIGQGAFLINLFVVLRRSAEPYGRSALELVRGVETANAEVSS